MAKSTRNARHITVDGVAYRWRAAGNDGWISLTVWPEGLAGPPIVASFSYHETWMPRGAGCWSSAGDQIVITNRLVRRVIQLAIAQFAYEPSTKGKQLNLPSVDEQIDYRDAVRANEGSGHQS